MADIESRNSIFLAAVPSLLLALLIGVMAAFHGWAEPEPQLAQAVTAQDLKPEPGPDTIVYTEEDAHHCDIGLDDVRNPPRFEDYPARRSISSPARPLLNNRLARLFRTVLRDGVTDGPDFAGNATIVRWGCGSSCQQWAIVDGRSGRVYAPPSEIDTMFGPSSFRDSGLHYRPGSRLIVLAGSTIWSASASRRAEQWHESATYLEWTGRSLRLLRTKSADELCAQHPGRLVAWHRTGSRHALNSSL